MVDVIYNSDTIQANGFAERPKPSLYQSADALRTAAKKLIEAMGVRMEDVLPKLAACGDAEAFYTDFLDSQFYLERIQKECSAIILAGTPERPLEELKAQANATREVLPGTRPGNPFADPKMIELRAKLKAQAEAGKRASEDPYYGTPLTKEMVAQFQAKAIEADPLVDDLKASGASEVAVESTPPLPIGGINKEQAMPTPKPGIDRELWGVELELVDDPYFGIFGHFDRELKKVKGIDADGAKVAEAALGMPIRDSIRKIGPTPTIDKLQLYLSLEKQLAAKTNPPAEPELSALQGVDLALDDDELTRKAAPTKTDAPDGIIDGVIIEEDKTQPLPKSDREKVAEVINEAFPDASKEYKQSFFKSVTGFASVEAAVKELGSAGMFKLLQEEIVKTKALASNLSTAETRPAAPPAEPAKVPPPQTSLALVTLPESNAITQPSTFKMPTPDEFAYMKEMARSIAATHFYAGVDTYEKAIVLFMQAYTLDINPFSALNGIDVMTGKGGKLTLYYRSTLLKAMVDKSKLCSRFDINSQNDKCTVTIQRKDRPSVNVYEYTTEDARAAGLLNKGGAWTENQKIMLMHRCVGRAIKAECPEILFSFVGAGVVEDEDAAA